MTKTLAKQSNMTKTWENKGTWPKTGKTRQYDKNNPEHDQNLEKQQSLPQTEETMEHGRKLGK